MAYTVTLDQLIARVRTYTDTVNAPTPTDGQIEGQLNAALRDLYAELCEGGAEFLSAYSTFTFPSDEGGFGALPDDFWRLRALTWARGERDNVKLRPFQSRDRADLMNQATQGTVPRYRLAMAVAGDAPKVELCPIPSQPITLRIDYIPDPPTVSDSGALSATPGLDEWIVLQVTIGILAAEETDVSYWVAQRAKQLAIVTKSLSLRDEYLPNAISDNDADGGFVQGWYR